MTKEEAAELVLKTWEEGWEHCTRKGLSYHPKTCWCEGSRVVLKAEYLEAHQLLGLPYPARTRMETTPTGALIVKGPPVYVGKFEALGKFEPSAFKDIWDALLPDKEKK